MRWLLQRLIYNIKLLDLSMAAKSHSFIGVYKDTGPFKGFKTTCDEYPFASTVEGGTGAHRSCVVGFQNSLQGGRLSAFYSNLNYGDQFVVRVSGIDCSTVKESDLQGCGGVRVKRQTNGETSSSGYEGRQAPII